MSSTTYKSHPNKTLEQHVEEIKRIFNKLVSFYEIETNKDILSLIKKVIELHDIGKRREEFQNYIKDLERGINRRPPGSHSLWSLKEIKEKKLYDLDIGELFPLLYFLIAKHHSNLNLEFREETKNSLKGLLLEHYGKFFDHLESKGISREKIKRDYKDLIEKIRDSNLRAFYKDYFRKFDKKLLITIADLYGLFKIADTLSAKNSIDIVNKICRIENNITEEKVKSLINKKIDEKRWRIQREISKYDYLILRAPTGWGKTTISLLFALDKSYKKIFITLPTITAIEKFYQKLREKFNVEMYFYFYDAYLHLENDIDDKINTLFYIRNLYSPINITTIDQILLSFLQAGKYFLKRVNLRKSILILDEIHLLTPQMLFLFKKFIEHLVSLYKVKLLLMSATLSKGIMEYLLENAKFGIIDIYGIWNRKYFDEKFYNRERVCFELVKKDILEDLEKIVEENRRGKSVLVIVNTVEKAVAIYKKLKDEYKINNILLLHARFMFKDRKEKEKYIEYIEKSKGILISTQIAEVSLDIDFDILFTELAPISSLIQRAGRVNRYGNKPKAVVYVYYPQEIKEIEEDKRKKYPYDIKEMEKTWKFLEKMKESGNFKEGELIKEIDNEFTKEFYEEIIKKEKIYKLYEEVFEKNSDYSVFWFLSSTSEEKGKELLDFKENITTLIIPYGELVDDDSLKEEIKKLINEYKRLKEKRAKYEEWMKFIAKTKSYTVPIPMWILAKANIEEKKYGFPVLEKLPEEINYKYFKEYGFINLEKVKKFGVELEDYSCFL